MYFNKSAWNRSVLSTNLSGLSFGATNLTGSMLSDANGTEINSTLLATVSPQMMSFSSTYIHLLLVMSFMLFFIIFVFVSSLCAVVAPFWRPPPTSRGYQLDSDSIWPTGGLGDGYDEDM